MVDFGSDEEIDRWLALLIDTEGAMGIYKVTYGGSTHRSYAPQMNINMGTPQVLEVAHTLIPKSCFNNWIRKQSKKMVWSLNGGANCLRELIPRIYPHLLIKKPEAELCMKVLKINYETRTARVMARYDRGKYDKFIDKQHARCEEAFQELKEIRRTRYPMMYPSVS